MQKSGPFNVLSAGSQHLQANSPSWKSLLGPTVHGPTTTTQLTHGLQHNSGSGSMSSSMNSITNHRQGRDGSLFIEHMGISVDPRKRELLEGRFVAEKGFVQDAHQYNQSDSNPSSASQQSSGSHTQQQVDMDKQTTPSSNEKRRKRKAPPDVNNGFNKSSRNESNCKRNSDYLKAGGSPGRWGNTNCGGNGGGGGSGGGSKTPSPLGYALYPSPQSANFAGTMALFGYADGHGHAPGATINSHLPTVPPPSCQHRCLQTDITYMHLQTMEKSASDISKKDSIISNLEAERDELKKQLSTQAKLVEKQKDMIQKCIDVTKTLLIEKSNLEKKTARQKCMENRLRLGQFVTQRQGASFAENWVDGFAFNDLLKQQERITHEREEMEKQRKQLSKRKPTNSTGTNKLAKATKEGDGFLKPADKP